MKPGGFTAVSCIPQNGLIAMAGRTRTERILETLFYDLPRYAAGILMLAALAINISNVVARYILRFSIYWADEAMVYLALWSIALAGIAIAWKRAHLNMDIVIASVFQRWRRTLGALSLIASVGIFAGMSALAARAIAVFAGTGQVSVAMGLPMTIPHAALFVSFACAALAIVIRMLFANKDSGQPDVQERLRNSI